MRRDRYRWLKKNFISPSTDFSRQDVTNGVQSLCGPLEYFHKFVTEDMIKAVADNTNQYSVQKKGSSIHTNTKEIEQMIGMYLKMGLVQMPGIRMYWEADTRYSPISDVMSRNRVQSLLASLHFVNNLTMAEKEQNADKLWKLRPWLHAFREKCLKVVPKEHNSVDEMMIPFRGKFSSIKQYMRGQPNPWGFKYKLPLKSCRWYLYIFWHTIILAVINAWLLYKRDCNALHIPKQQVLNRRLFEAQLASSLLLIGTGVSVPKRGRPSSSPVSLRGSTLTSHNRLFTDEGSPAAKMPKKSNAHPPKEVRKDMIGHFPIKADRVRCINCAKGYTNMLCKKCNVRLCFSEQNNCFWDYHN
uniref:PiggyBac transposable element-derived protein domain-containing protein n=1 Tax=Nothobranchius furzeri TaxID=105023 RepID=A0A8C6KSC4_NOTFU